MDIKAYYEAAEIRSLAKKMLASNLLKLFIYIALIALAVVVIIFFGKSPFIFIESIALIIISVYLLITVLRRISLPDYTETVGEIKKLHREVTATRNIYSSNVNLFGIRKYDKYVKRQTRLTLYISHGDKVSAYQINGATPRLEEYYEEGGEVVHLFGTHYPVKVPTGKEWLCPLCGEFNSGENVACRVCKLKILK